MQPAQNGTSTPTRAAGWRPPGLLVELLALGGLVATEAGAARVGMIPGMAPAADVVFGLGGVVVVAYLGSRLGVLSEARKLLADWRSSEDRRAGPDGKVEGNRVSRP